MKVKTPKYEGHTNYIVYFKKSDNIKISQLRDIKSICQILVKWSFYSHNKGEVTQCSNCQGFGHGTQNCHLKPVCIKCAGNHQSKTCPLEKDEKGLIPSPKLVCIHCGQNHTANYHKCIKRKEYISKMQALKKPNTKRTPPEPPQLNDTNFPFLGNAQTSNQRVSAWINNSTNQQTAQVNSNNTELFSPQECLNIFNEFLTKISQCTSRQQQLQVIAQLALNMLK